MERKGQTYLLIGVLMALCSMILYWDFIPEKEWIDFVSGICTGISIVFVLQGIILIIRSKMKRK